MESQIIELKQRCFLTHHWNEMLNLCDHHNNTPLHPFSISMDPSSVLDFDDWLKPTSSSDSIPNIADKSSFYGEILHRNIIGSDLTGISRAAIDNWKGSDKESVGLGMEPLSSNLLGASPAEADDPVVKNMVYNSKKEAWDCGICKRSFREKVDLYQHLKSGTHDAKKFTCTDCGKSFVSMGALTQHRGQAGHSKNKNTSAPDSPNLDYKPPLGSSKISLEPDSYSSLEKQNFNRTESHPSSAFSRTESNLTSLGRTESSQTYLFGRTDSVPSRTSPLKDISMSSMPLSHYSSTLPSSLSSRPTPSILPVTNPVPYNSTSYLSAMPPVPTSFISPLPPNEFRFSGYSLRNYTNTECVLYVASVSIPYATQGSCAWIVRDEQRNVVVSEGGHAVRKKSPNSLLPEYEGLYHGLVDAYNHGISCLRVFSDNETLMSHLSNSAGIKYSPSRDITVEEIVNDVKMICGRFPDITFHMIAKEYNHRAQRIASRYIERL